MLVTIETMAATIISNTRKESSHCYQKINVSVSIATANIYNIQTVISSNIKATTAPQVTK